MVRKSKKIRLYLSKQQQQMVDRWFGVARYVYNRTVEYLRQPETKANWKAIKGGILDSLPDFCADVPYQIKSIAVRDACIAVREKPKKKYMVEPAGARGEVFVLVRTQFNRVTSLSQQSRQMEYITRSWVVCAMGSSCPS
jgi:hypothetical protein